MLRASPHVTFLMLRIKHVRYSNNLKKTCVWQDNMQLIMALITINCVIFTLLFHSMCQSIPQEYRKTGPEVNIFVNDRSEFWIKRLFPTNRANSKLNAHTYIFLITFIKTFMNNNKVPNFILLKIRKVTWKALDIITNMTKVVSTLISTLWRIKKN